VNLRHPFRSQPNLPRGELVGLGPHDSSQVAGGSSFGRGEPALAPDPAMILQLQKNRSRSVNETETHRKLGEAERQLFFSSL
jgi:hypothetical protein